MYMFDTNRIDKSNRINKKIMRLQGIILQSFSLFLEKSNKVMYNDSQREEVLYVEIS